MRKLLYTTTHHRHQYLSCYLSDLKQTLKVGFWDQQQRHEQEQEQEQQEQEQLKQQQ